MKSIPQKGQDRASLLTEMENMKANDLRWRDGRNFSYVYFPGDEIVDTVKQAYQAFFSENALNPSAFPSLRRMESEVVAMSAHLLGGSEATRGSLTSGGTESILMAVKTARAWGQKHKQIAAPEIVLPATAHPAFHKACYYFGLKAIVVPIGTDFRADVPAMRAAINPNTVMIVGSAPAYPQGVIDPIRELAALAQEKEILCHVDACVGGFMLPFLRQTGYPIADFDLSVPGVTSISADIHKYGYAAKGASVVLYRDAELRKLQFYVYTPWSGGIYGSPTMTGTRPGGAIAAAWAALHHIGLEGYQRLARQTKTTADRLRSAIEAIPELKILGQPDMTILCMASDVVDIYEVGDELAVKGDWFIDRQQLPPSLHLTITPAHEAVLDEFIADLKAAVKKSRQLTLNKLSKMAQVNAIKGMKKLLPEQLFERFQSFAAKNAKVGGKRSAAMYGMMGELQGSGNLDDLIREFLDQLMG